LSPDTDTDTDTASADAEAPATDDLRAGLLATFESELGEAVAGSHLEPGTGLWVRVTVDAWATAAAVAKAKLGCRWFDFLSAIDWMASPFGRYEDAELDTADTLVAKVEAARAAPRPTGLAGGDTRFQLLAHVVDTAARHDVFLKADVPDDALTAPTWTGTYAGANWHERETWEMYGIVFEGHPDLRHLYLPGDFEGNPLRKDFPLLARIVKPWPGVVDVEPMPGEGPADVDVAGEAAPSDEEAAAEEGDA
jgi:NADH-quinone oxidoreductase subunit C